MSVMGSFNDGNVGCRWDSDSFTIEQLLVKYHVLRKELFENPNESVIKELHVVINRAVYIFDRGFELKSKENCYEVVKFLNNILRSTTSREYTPGQLNALYYFCWNKFAYISELYEELIAYMNVKSLCSTFYKFTSNLAINAGGFALCDAIEEAEEFVRALGKEYVSNSKEMCGEIIRCLEEFLKVVDHPRIDIFGSACLRTFNKLHTIGYGALVFCKGIMRHTGDFSIKSEVFIDQLSAIFDKLRKRMFENSKEPITKEIRIVINCAVSIFYREFELESRENCYEALQFINSVFVNVDRTQPALKQLNLLYDFCHSAFVHVSKLYGRLTMYIINLTTEPEIFTEEFLEGAPFNSIEQLLLKYNEMWKKLLENPNESVIKELHVVINRAVSIFERGLELESRENCYEALQFINSVFVDIDHTQPVSEQLKLLCDFCHSKLVSVSKQYGEFAIRADKAFFNRMPLYTIEQLLAMFHETQKELFKNPNKLVIEKMRFIINNAVSIFRREFELKSRENCRKARKFIEHVVENIPHGQSMEKQLRLLYDFSWSAFVYTSTSFGALERSNFKPHENGF